MVGGTTRGPISFALLSLPFTRRAHFQSALARPDLALVRQAIARSDISRPKRRKHEPLPAFCHCGPASRHCAFDRFERPKGGQWVDHWPSSPASQIALGLSSSTSSVSSTDRRVGFVTGATNYGQPLAYDGQRFSSHN